MAFDLEDGHILNLQSRQRRDNKGMVYHYEANETRDGAVELSARAESNDSEAGLPAISPQSKHTPTRLPVLKVLTDKDQRERKDAVSGERKARDGSPEYESPKSLNQDRERYWRKLRDKLDRDTSSARDIDKQKVQGAYRKFISLASSSRQEISRHKWKYSSNSSSEKSNTSEVSPASKTTSSTAERLDNSKKSISSDGDQSSNGNKRTKSNHSASSNGSGASSLRWKSSSTADSSYHSNSSVSPISGRSASMKEWEDRFVVHMPSAREPNPPTMNVRQISQYQRSIENVQKDGGSMVDPDTLPSPRNGTPEQHPTGKRVGTLDGQDSRASYSNDDTELEYHPDRQRYYCPDEVGKQRFSTIWEESSSGPKSPKQPPPNANPDGSFLGCKEINGPHDQNPDEILYFSTPERPKVVNIAPSRMPRASKDSKIATMRPRKTSAGETSLVQEEWEPISRNLKHAQCWKPSPRLLCRDTQCQQTKTKKSTGPDASDDQESIVKQTVSSENRRPNPSPDDVFIITPTITRTMVTMTDLRNHLPKQSGLREPTARSAGEIITDARTRLPTANTKTGAPPSGLRRATQNSWEKSNAPSATSSDPALATNMSGVGRQVDTKGTAVTEESIGVTEKPRGIRGYTRTPGIPRSSTESRIDLKPGRPSDPGPSEPSMKASNMPPRRSTPYYSKLSDSRSINRASCSPPTHKNSSPPRDTIMQAKIVDVAELDGNQLHDRRDDKKLDADVLPTNNEQRDTQIQAESKRARASETFHMVIDMIFLFVAQVQGFYHQVVANRGSKAVLLKLFLNGILGMLEHCLHVLKRGLSVISAYNTTGVWPKHNDMDLAWLFTDLGQALIYLVVLGFVAMVIARAVGFVMLIGSWVMWFAKPFIVATRTLSRMVSV
ncbi:hypothetical protein BDV18DRAFT_159280 [Aspergillus unguis]